MHSNAFNEYNRLINESLQIETYSHFVDHIVQFRPDFRENFIHFHQTIQRQNTIKKLKEFNQIYSKTQDQRYHNLIENLTDYHFKSL